MAAAESSRPVAPHLPEKLFTYNIHDAVKIFHLFRKIFLKMPPGLRSDGIFRKLFSERGDFRLPLSLELEVRENVVRGLVHII